jgi:hypothetical protein
MKSKNKNEKLASDIQALEANREAESKEEYKGGIKLSPKMKAKMKKAIGKKDC